VNRLGTTRERYKEKDHVDADLSWTRREERLSCNAGYRSISRRSRSFTTAT